MLLSLGGVMYTHGHGIHLAAALAHRPNSAQALSAVIAHVLAALVGITHFTNSIQGEFAIPGMAVAAGFAVWGARTCARFGRYLLTAYGLSLLLFVGYGAWHRGFPELG